MLETATGVIGTAGAGAIIKIIAGLVQNMFDAGMESKRARHERFMAQRQMEIKAYEVQTSNPYTSRTRRVLAYIVCITLCLISCYNTVFPDIVFFAIPPSAGGPESHSVFFGLIEWTTNPKLEAFIVTSGSMAYAFVHAGIMYLGFYFTPIGKK